MRPDRDKDQDAVATLVKDLYIILGETGKHGDFSRTISDLLFKGCHVVMYDIERGVSAVLRMRTALAEAEHMLSIYEEESKEKGDILERVFGDRDVNDFEDGVIDDIVAYARDRLGLDAEEDLKDDTKPLEAT